MWALSSSSYQTITEKGIHLTDVSTLTLSGLPFLPLPLLETDRKPHLQHFGNVLDYGVSKKEGYYVGGGYATIELPPDPCSKDSRCTSDHVYHEHLNREIVWDEEDGEFRKITLTWDTVPDFCRCCVSTCLGYTK
ncbi:hypothetical protein [Parasitella parasitica]|uniref:Uncharacterized protein n=1 Tax=Parasitella parasitica TaxID=35722 RepID=A0A0B7N7Q5_9FUNG|nr:hypothetical protein [Parasitella parasitica]